MKKKKPAGNMAENKEIKKLNHKTDNVSQRMDDVTQKMDDVLQRFRHLDTNISRVFLSTENQLGKIETRLGKIEHTMVTKEENVLVLDRIDHFSKKMFLFDQEERDQSLHLKEVRQQVDQHEARLITLEGKRV